MANGEKTILVLHKDNGKFYKAIGVDAEVLNYLFGYQIINNRAGFPDNAIDRVRETLEENKISYQIIYTDINPIIKDYGEENRYLNILEIAKSNYEITKRIQTISEKIQALDEKKKEQVITKIEELLNLG